MTTKINKLSSELEEEREMNRCLRANQLEWQSRVHDLEQRLAKKDTVSPDDVMPVASLIESIQPTMNCSCLFINGNGACDFMNINRTRLMVSFQGLTPSCRLETIIINLSHPRFPMKR